MPPRKCRAPRVLVVDDELEMAEMLADGLADRGYRTTAVASSEEAVAACATSASTRSSPICACPRSTGSRCSRGRGAPRPSCRSS